MRAEETLQFMMDFYPELFPSRKHYLNHLFCTIGNGYDWRKGELVDSQKERPEEAQEQQSEGMRML